MVTKGERVARLFDDSVGEVVFNEHLSHTSKHVVDIHAIFGTNFHERNTVLVAQSLSFPCLYCSLILYINFVCDEHLYDVFGSMIVDLLHPSFCVGSINTYVFKGPALGDRVDKDDACSSFVVSLCDIFETFLTSCVPYLQFDSFVTDADGLYFEINSDSRNIVWLESVLTESDQDIGLAYATVSDYYQF